MQRKNRLKIIVAFAVTLAFVMPVAVVANNEGSTNNSETAAEIDSAGLCPLLYYDAEDTDITIDTSNLGVLGDRFYAYNAYDPGGVLPIGPVYFDSENPGTITSLAPTTSDEFISGATWAKGIWYGCEYTGNLWIINESDGTMTLIGYGGSGLNGLDYDRTTDTMYGAVAMTFTLLI